MNHPSSFALDSYVVDPRSGDVDAHVRSCPQCQAHVAAARVAVPFPPALKGLGPAKPTPWWRFVVPALAAAGVVMSVGYFVKSEPGSITAKGLPAAAVWLNRGGKVVAWNGQPLRAGDTVRIEVAPAGFTHVTVFDEKTREVLYEARVPGDAPTLTPAWQLDAAPGSESLRVVISNSPVDQARLEASCRVEPASYCTRFTLPRE